MAMSTESPSILVKALAFAVKSKMTFDPDLSASGASIFIGTLQQKGIPIGVPPEYANEQLYQLANTIQTNDSLAIRSGQSDYFKFQSDYLANSLQLNQSGSRTTPEHQTYLNARKAVDAEYRKLRNTFEEKRKTNPTTLWQDHVKSSDGDAYRKAWEDRDTAVVDIPVKDFSLLLQLLDSAQARAEPHDKQNMPAIMGDIDVTTASQPVDSKAVIYRPLHYLSGFRADSIGWRDQFNQDIYQPSWIEIDLRHAVGEKWATLGFPAFDKLQVPFTNAEVSALEGWKVQLSYTGMMNYAVHRGLWDVPNFRTLFDQPVAAADLKLTQPVNKTTSLLLAYGLQLRVQVPVGVLGPGTTEDMLWDITEGVPLQRISDTVLQTSKPTNDAYPILLGMLTQKL
ncbi:hypothetical protein KVT40_003040 [Elsinoe batatas]|uniref:Uncharacterized protein n=1 Tax=Elsinoe batatas TaxID=2601811 RepID=A0A8K0PEG1_9PEZI|nr:hypothetical protein KVT40_003040 [Elsinoe batatas]